LESARHIDEAHNYGSWATRYVGEPGTEPQDIDLLVIGTPAVETSDGGSTLPASN